MTAKSNYLASEILDHTLGEGARDFTSPAALWMALDTTVATAADTGTSITEPSGGYSRQAISFDAASSGSSQLSGAIEFGPCTGSDWSSVGHGIVVDANSVGNAIYWGAWNTARVCVVGGKLTVAVVDFTVSEA